MKGVNSDHTQLRYVSQQFYSLRGKFPEGGDESVLTSELENQAVGDDQNPIILF